MGHQRRQFFELIPILFTPPATPATSQPVKYPLVDFPLERISLQLIFLTAALIGVLFFFFFITRRANKLDSRVVFFAITACVFATTALLIMSTLFLTFTSWSKGPIDWRAYLEIWACDKEYSPYIYDSKEQTYGPRIIYDKDQKQIQLRGLMKRPEDSTLTQLIEGLGGELTAQSLMLPINNGTVRFTNNDRCGQDKAEVQVFVYHMNRDGTFAQRKIMAFSDYQIQPFSSVPPGDCIVIEFSPPKDRTDKKCRSYSQAQYKGELRGEVNGWR